MRAVIASFAAGAMSLASSSSLATPSPASPSPSAEQCGVFFAAVGVLIAPGAYVVALDWANGGYVPLDLLACDGAGARLAKAGVVAGTDPTAAHAQVFSLNAGRGAGSIIFMNHGPKGWHENGVVASFEEDPDGVWRITEAVIASH